MRSRNSPFVLFGFFCVILLQMTTYKYIWGIELIGRVLNILSLIMFSIIAFISIIKYKYNKSITNLYIIPGILFYIGVFINVTICSINNNLLVSNYGLLIAWAIYLSIPYFVKFNKINPEILWRYFYYFMFLSTVLSLIEYILFYFNLTLTRDVYTAQGRFLGGYFSLLFPLESGDFHYRLYSSFFEPGTLALYLLIAIIYSIYSKRYISILIFILALFMSDSLGGYISLLVLLLVIIYRIYGLKKIFILSALVIISIILFYPSIFGNIADIFFQKTASLSVRTNNINKVLENIPSLLINYPIGMPLYGSTEEALLEETYLGTNFAIGNAFALGGILALVGYCVIIFVSLKWSLLTILSKKMGSHRAAAAISLIVIFPFIFQRMTLWDSGLFSFLISPFIIDYLHGKTKEKNVADAD